MRGSVRGWLAGCTAIVALLAGCTGEQRRGGDGDGPGAGSASRGPSFTVRLTPADNATGVPVSEEIGLAIDGGPSAGGDGTATTDLRFEVKLVDAAGKAVPGVPRPDHSSWVPDSPLNYDTKYTATVTARRGEGAPATATTSFTTMSRPGNRMRTHIFMADNAVYGQAMPVVVEFTGGVPPASRAAVERRLFVRSDPPQPGVWHWDSAIQAEYRPEAYWQPGTKLDIRLGLGGLPLADGRYGATDITVRASIDTVRRAITVDNAAKTLTATQDDQVVKTMPVSLGKPSKPSFSGTMVVMERLENTVFDSSTYGTPVNGPDGYRTAVQYAERLTWDGQFIHAAPWSVGDQGRRNVSHGCVNVSTENGKWVFDWVKVGDPVVITGTERSVNAGNGWTAWNMSWSQHQAGSALRQPAPSAPAGSPAPSAS